MYLNNRSTNSIRLTTTPLNLLNNSRVFESIGYAHVDKPEAKSFKCMFIAYDEDFKVYRVHDLESNKVKVSRSVKLDEREVNGIYDTTTAKDSTIIYVTKDAQGSALPEWTEQPADDETLDSVGEEAVEDVEMQGSSPGQELTTYRSIARPTMDENMYVPDASMNQYFISKTDQNTMMSRRTKYAADIGDATDAPTTYQQPTQSCQSSEWVEPMNTELKAHAHNESWMLVPRTPSARSVQKFGVDFFETYSPVANTNLIRIVLSVVVTLRYVTEPLDADTAFLYSDLRERLCMEVPNAKNMMSRLDKANYGLKQTTSAWHKPIHRGFVKIGSGSCGVDKCVYVKAEEGRYVYICLYVNDIIITAKTSEEIREVNVTMQPEIPVASAAALTGEPELEYGTGSLANGRPELWKYIPNAACNPNGDAKYVPNITCNPNGSRAT
ncbi:LOW QUALITY PROTEIN: polyprotein [Phytophthora megakarya]|uniref:Polyprotein n=1 Tax=Phytophthora megakarya TaxID=4795 RepID=A0A225W8Z9_9STRA|nr:LOW QUALITY PROTEIN: polyprotein [Phytophthora megakarya]